MTIPFHPLAEIFPLIEGKEFDALVEDIREHGLREPIVLYRDQILDGRNRYRACMAARRADCRFEKYEGNDPAAYVVSLNLKRRHLNESQRAMVATKLTTLKRGDNQHSPIGETSQARAAELLNVGKRTVERAADVRDRGAVELQRAVERGDVSVSAAADIASLPIERQREIVANIDRKVLLAEAKQVRTEQAEARRAERIQKFVEISRSNSQLPTAVRYPVILADPPWFFKTYTNNDTYDRAPDYPTLKLDEICALPVRDLATESAVLFLWTNSAHLRLAFDAIEAWGFAYSTSAVWCKSDCAPGLGHFVRQQHETLLIGRRGDFPLPPPSTRPSSVIVAPRREHSRKPDEVYEIIERMYPELPKIELFARGKREGWAVWGNQAEVAA